MRMPNLFRRKRSRNAVGDLSLVSLMDILTNVLLFLLVYQAGAELLTPPSEALKLPTSTAQKLPSPTIVVTVTRDEIFVEGKKVMTVREALQENRDSLPPLKEELTRLATRSNVLSQGNPSMEFTGRLTVMGDRKIPFELLKKVMATGAQAQYRNISLAVLQKDAVLTENRS